MKSLKILFFLVLLASPSRAALSILIQPGPIADTTFFTVTQTSPSPVLNVSGIGGYVSGISIPTSMFQISSSGSAASSDIQGDLSDSLATITEVFSGQTFLLNRLRVSADPSAPSSLWFDRPYTVPVGATSLRFDVTPAGTVGINISYEALVPGFHTINDVAFGAVNVTVIPETSTCAFLAVAVLPRFRRKRGCRTVPAR
jgi:hypothetical protein